MYDRYIAQFRAALKHVPETERDDMVREIESHIAEALNAGRSLAEVLQRLGPADRLARAMAAEAILTGHKDQPRLRRWWTVLRLVTFTGVPSLVIVPFLSIFGYLFLFGGSVGMLASLLSFIAPNNVETSLPHPDFYGGKQLVIFLAATLMFGLGTGLTRALKAYIRSVLTTVQEVLH